MTTAVVGAGPVGMVCALALAERGEQVLLLDRDAGPAPDGSWKRKGVMQFLHPHFYRFQVRMVLEQHAPSMWDAVVAAGCVVNPAPPGVPEFATTVAARRSVFEAALRRAVAHERLDVVPEHADRVVLAGGRVTGVVAAGRTYDVDRVVVATGRTSRFADDLRPPGQGGACGQSYVSRMYRARPGVEPLVSWTPLGALYDGYQTIAFPQDDGTLSALVVRPSDDEAWTAIWSNAAFEAAVAQIPNLAPWTDPDRFEPITDVMRGGTLVNAYRGQGDPPAGLFWVGDAVCTTNPAAGRGMALGMLQADALLQRLAAHEDHRDASADFDAWCAESIRPWYDDHVQSDASTLRSYAHQDIDPDGPLSPDVLAAALDDDPSLAPAIGPYLVMVAPPTSLQAIAPQVRAMLRGGWRPRIAAGPSRDELLEQMRLVPA